VTNTPDQQSALVPVAGTIEAEDFTELLSLSQTHHVPLMVVRKYWKDFQEFDLKKDNRMQRHEFTEAIRNRCSVPQDCDLSETHFIEQWFQATSQHGEFVDFESFFLWSFGSEHMDELLVPDAKELSLRKLARKHNQDQSRVDSAKDLFDRFDLDRSGVLDESSFMRMVHHLHAGEVVGPATVKRWCLEVHAKSSGVSLDAFLVWYFRPGQRNQRFRHTYDIVVGPCRFKHLV